MALPGCVAEIGVQVRQRQSELQALVQVRRRVSYKLLSLLCKASEQPRLAPKRAMGLLLGAQDR